MVRLIFFLYEIESKALPDRGKRISRFANSQSPIRAALQAVPLDLDIVLRSIGFAQFDKPAKERLVTG
jgi:hypothetical protein